MKTNDALKSKGDVVALIEWKDGKRKEIGFNNTVLLSGRRALARSLANSFGDSYDFFVARMIFGDGGTQSGVKKYVDAGREGLFGVTRVSKPIIANIDVGVPAQVIFTSVITFDEAIGITLNEMALQMATGEFFSMVTFPDLNKTEEMQITWNWRLNFI